MILKGMKTTVILPLPFSCNSTVQSLPDRQSSFRKYSSLYKNSSTHTNSLIGVIMKRGLAALERKASARDERSRKAKAKGKTEGSEQRTKLNPPQTGALIIFYTDRPINGFDLHHASSLSHNVNWRVFQVKRHNNHSFLSL